MVTGAGSDGLPGGAILWVAAAVSFPRRRPVRLEAPHGTTTASHALGSRPGHGDWVTKGGWGVVARPQPASLLLLLLAGISAHLPAVSCRR